MGSPKFSISDVADQRQCLEDLKLAIESLLGNGHSEKPYMARAMTAQDLIDLGLVTAAQIKFLERNR